MSHVVFEVRRDMMNCWRSVSEGVVISSISRHTRMITVLNRYLAKHFLHKPLDFLTVVSRMPFILAYL